MKKIKNHNDTRKVTLLMNIIFTHIYILYYYYNKITLKINSILTTILRVMYSAFQSKYKIYTVHKCKYVQLHMSMLKNRSYTQKRAQVFCRVLFKYFFFIISIIFCY